MIRPPFLRKGDAIGIVAPAGCLAEEELTPALDLIRSWELSLVLGKHLYARRNSFAGTDAERAGDFQEMLDDQAIRAILCARGGYGTLRIIRRLNFDRFLRYPKWIAGYSDITVLHAFLQEMLGVESIHGAMPRTIPPDVPDLASLDSLRAALFGEVQQYTLPPHPLNREGTARGVLTGGNLSVLYSLAGSDLEPATAQRILFLEDTGEYLYHIDRMLMNFSYRGRLDNLAALMIGHMDHMKFSRSGFRKPAHALIREHVSDKGYPVLLGLPAGHLHPNMSLYMGREVEITVTRNYSSITFSHGKQPNYRPSGRGPRR